MFIILKSGQNIFLSRIEPDKIDGVINVEESQIVLENVFLPEMLDEKR